jgi:hypothetical protein
MALMVADDHDPYKAGLDIEENILPNERMKPYFHWDRARSTSDQNSSAGNGVT